MVIRTFILGDDWTALDRKRAWEEFVNLYEVYGKNQPINYTFQDNSHWRGLLPIVRRQVLRNIFLGMQANVFHNDPGKIISFCQALTFLLLPPSSYH